MAQARPGLTVGPENVSLDLAQVSYFLLGHWAVGPGLPKIVQNCYLGPARVSSRAMILWPRPHHWAKKCGLGP
jgi:hypothetical protein